MLRILSDLTITSRVDIAPSTGVTYAQGEWVTVTGTKTGTASYIPLGCVFNMTDSSGNIGLSKDADGIALNSVQDATIGAADKITLITGPFRGVTDKVSDAWGTNASAGDPLTVVSGLLVRAPLTTAQNGTVSQVVAILEEKLTNFEHRGTTYATAWRFKTV